MQFEVCGLASFLPLRVNANSASAGSPLPVS